MDRRGNIISIPIMVDIPCGHKPLTFLEYININKLYFVSTFEELSSRCAPELCNFRFNEVLKKLRLKFALVIKIKALKYGFIHFLNKKKVTEGNLFLL